MKFSTKGLYVLGGIIFGIFFTLILWKVPQTQSYSYLQKFPPESFQDSKSAEKLQLEKNAADIENAARLTIAQIFGGLALLLGLYFTYQNVITAQDNLRVTEEGKLTDRFSKAIELLGSEKLDVRLGGIHALERIARDSKKDHWTVMEILTAFVRENSHKKVEPEDKSDKSLTKQNDSLILSVQNENLESVQIKPREDIQAIMTVIGRRKWIEIETQTLNLQGVNLSNFSLSVANLLGADLSGANLNNANLSKANLCRANLNNADLSKAILHETNLNSADLSRAILNEANLNNADLSKANLNEANLFVASLNETHFENADLKGASFLLSKHLKLDQILIAINFEETSLPEELKKELEHWKTEKLFSQDETIL